jgi:hypothetical protein
MHCSVNNGILEARLSPRQALGDLFPEELEARFERLDDDFIDRRTGTRFSEDGAIIRASSGRAGNQAPEPAVETLLLHAVLLTLRDHGRDPVLIHGAAIVPPDSSDAWLLVGPSGAGKSTLTALLCRRGFACLSDEVVVVDGPDVLSYPRATALRERPAEPHVRYTSGQGETKFLLSPAELGSPSPPASARASRLFLLEPFADEVEWTELEASEAARDVLPSVYTGRTDPVRQFFRLAHLCGSLDCHRMRPGSAEATADHLENLHRPRHDRMEP